MAAAVAQIISWPSADMVLCLLPSSTRAGLPPRLPFSAPAPNQLFRATEGDAEEGRERKEGRKEEPESPMLLLSPLPRDYANSAPAPADKRAITQPHRRNFAPWQLRILCGAPSMGSLGSHERGGGEEEGESGECKYFPTLCP